MGNSIKLILFGAAPDTPNMGVSALFHSTLAGIHQRLPSTEFTVFDNGLGCRTGEIELADGQHLQYERRGGRSGRKYYRPENLETMLALSRLGRAATSLHGNLQVIAQANAVLDVSGGDSFTDLYGKRRFYSVLRPKQIALSLGRPLILLPQTYGPFKNPKYRAMAAEVVRSASMCWARDERSYDVLKDLVGKSFDPDRHRCGVDLAFSLSPKNAEESVPKDVSALIDSDRSATPLVGFNVSGLIYNDPTSATERYGFRADYRGAVDSFLHWLLASTHANVVLIPHVMSPPGHYESDEQACQTIKELLVGKYPKRIAISPTTLNQNEVKWLISQMDWFCGTRMHATIAALSSEIPTATVSYSDKALGVFETCGQGEHVIDPREMDTEEVVNHLKNSFACRDATESSLAEQLPGVKGRGAEQLDALCECILRSAPQLGRSQQREQDVAN